MTQIMRAAVQLDTEASKNELEYTSQLVTENKLLRELLDAKISANGDQMWEDISLIKEKNDALLRGRDSVDSFISCMSQAHSDSSSDVTKWFYIFFT